MNPKISVIMSVYNDSHYLKQSIEGILNQSFRDFEFIIINDYSSDDSRRIIEQYMQQDKRIILVNNAKNIGLTKSLNHGIDIAKGEYIARQDADDVSLSKRFELQLQFLENNPDIFLAGTNSYVFTEGSKRFVKGTVCGSKKIKKYLAKDNPIIHSSIIFRNNQKIRYRKKFYYAQDYDLLLSAISKGLNIDNLKEPLVLYRVNDQGISATKAAIQNAFGRKALEFYFQREKSGKDDYDSFDQQELFRTGPQDFRKCLAKYNSMQFLIDIVIYSNKKEAIKLIFNNIRTLPKKYVMKKMMLLCLPRNVMEMRRGLV